MGRLVDNYRLHIFAIFDYFEFYDPIDYRCRTLLKGARIHKGNFIANANLFTFIRLENDNRAMHAARIDFRDLALSGNQWGKDCSKQGNPHRRRRPFEP